MKIYIDYDSTLNSFIYSWTNWINENYKNEFKVQDINTWDYFSKLLGKSVDDFWKTEYIYKDSNYIIPLNNSIDFFNKVKSIFGEDRVFIISSTPRHLRSVKLAHIVKYYNTDFRQVIFTEKTKYQYTYDGILIDDFPLHIFEHIIYNKSLGIIFTQNNEYAWCNKNNYSKYTLPKRIFYKDKELTNLNDLLRIVDLDKLMYAKNYDDIIKYLSY